MWGFRICEICFSRLYRDINSSCLGKDSNYHCTECRIPAILICSRFTLRNINRLWSSLNWWRSTSTSGRSQSSRSSTSWSTWTRRRWWMPRSTNEYASPTYSRSSQKVSTLFLYPVFICLSNIQPVFPYPIFLFLCNIQFSSFYPIFIFSSNIRHSVLSFRHHSLYDLYLNNCFTHST